ncbi:MAG: DNA primase, partial [Propionicimonas sp.]|nr:DNA primase [Propionicimonas sp.]
ALKVFKGDQRFSSQTYVAVEPSGLDPCDLRIQKGDAAVRELVGRRIPLYTFVMRNTISGFDLERVEGRTAALRAAAPLISSIRDNSLVLGYIRELAKMLGVSDPDEVAAEVKRVRSGARPHEPVAEPRRPEELQLPDPRDRRWEAERGTLRLLVRVPEVFSPTLNDLVPDDFTHPAYRLLFERISAVEDRTGDWAQRLIDEADDPVVGQLVITLSVEPALREPTEAYAAEYAAGVQLLSTARQIDALKSRLQRTNPVEDQPAYNRMFAALVDLESRRKRLLALATGPAI